MATITCSFHRFLETKCDYPIGAGIIPSNVFNESGVRKFSNFQSVRLRPDITETVQNKTTSVRLLLNTNVKPYRPILLLHAGAVFDDLQ